MTLQDRKQIKLTELRGSAVLGGSPPRHGGAYASHSGAESEKMVLRYVEELASEAEMRVVALSR